MPLMSGFIMGVCAIFFGKDAACCFTGGENGLSWPLFVLD
jgi:hypothetical protein